MSSTVHEDRYVLHPGMLRQEEEPDKTSASWTSPGLDLSQPGAAMRPATSAASPSMEQDPERWDGLA